jgi:hypothetical protein
MYITSSVHFYILNWHMPFRYGTCFQLAPLPLVNNTSHMVVRYATEADMPFTSRSLFMYGSE